MWLRLARDIHMAWLAILKSLSYSAATGYCYCYSFCCYCCCLFPCALCAALAVIAIATNCRAAIAICLLVAAVTASDFHVERFASPCCCCFCGFCCYYVYFISNCELSVHNNSRYTHTYTHVNRCFCFGELVLLAQSAFCCLLLFNFKLASNLFSKCL